MGQADISMGDGGPGLAPPVHGPPGAFGFGDPQSGTGLNTEEDLLSGVLIEDAIKEKDREDKSRDWHNWLPELETKLKDKLLSVMADRFKIESIAESASLLGANSVAEVLKMLSDMEPEMRKIYPRYAWIDGLYKYMKDKRK